MEEKQSFNFKSIYNKTNNIEFEKNLDINDNIDVSLLDIIGEKTITKKVLSWSECFCVSHNWFDDFYKMCDKCKGDKKILFSGNHVVCNRCKGKGYISKRDCQICDNKGHYLKREQQEITLKKENLETSLIIFKNKGKESKVEKGDLILNLNIYDRQSYLIKNNDIYSKKEIFFTSEEIKKKEKKVVLTPFGKKEIFPKDKEEKELFKIEKYGKDKKGDFYVPITKQMPPTKGEERQANIFLKKKLNVFYLSNKEIFDLKNVLTPYYKIPYINKDYYTKITLNDIPFNHQILKLKEKGLKGKYGGKRGDIFAKFFVGDKIFLHKERVFDFSYNFSQKEIENGKKMLKIGNKTKILSFPKKLEKITLVKIGNFGLLGNNKKQKELLTRVKPHDFDVFYIKIKASNTRSKIYIKDYKKYFYEDVSFKTKKENEESLLIDLKKYRNNKTNMIKDDQNNVVFFKIIKKEPLNE